MILISHRGNLTGSQPEKENQPDYIQNVIGKTDFHVEVDVWCFVNKLWLGHDRPIYPISLEFFNRNKFRFWIHCKNLSALNYFLSLKVNNSNLYNFFFHKTDNYTLTSNNFIWTYPKNPVVSRSILVVDGAHHQNIKKFECYGICSDYILTLRNQLKNK